MTICYFSATGNSLYVARRIGLPHITPRIERNQRHADIDDVQTLWVLSAFSSLSGDLFNTFIYRLKTQNNKYNTITNNHEDNIDRSHRICGRRKANSMKEVALSMLTLSREGYEKFAITPKDITILANKF